MSVMLETSLGDLVIDLEVENCPGTCENFLKLCKIKYYALNAFFNVSKDFIAQTGDPSATGTGGESLASYLHGINPAPGRAKPPRYFPPEIKQGLKHVARGTVSMAVSPTDPPGCGSQFFITLADNIEYLDGRHAVFGHVIEGFETLDKINDAFLDKEGRPLQDIRIRHIEILEDPFPDPANLIAVPPSPIRPPDDVSVVRIADTEDPLAKLDEEEAEQQRRDTAAKSSALTLEMIGDIPFAAVRPPENILFVCKLNPVTQDEDLELIFSRFGKILSCEIVRDRATGDSLQYAFIEFDEQSSAEQAYFKMQNVLVDDRRIWVDFSQSVAKMNLSAVTGGGRGRGRGRGGFSRGGGGGGAGGRGGYGGHGSGPSSRDNGYGSRGNGSSHHSRSGADREDRLAADAPRRHRSRSPWKGSDKRRDTDDRDRREGDRDRSSRRDSHDDRYRRRSRSRSKDRRRDERDRDRDRDHRREKEGHRSSRDGRDRSRERYKDDDRDRDRRRDRDDDRRR